MFIDGIENGMREGIMSVIRDKLMNYARAQIEELKRELKNQMRKG